MKRLIALAAILCSVGLIGFMAQPATATDSDFSDGITVDSTGDAPDANTADSTCNDGAGNCTLRAAIQEANDTPGTQTIDFAIAGTGVHTISPGTELPGIIDPVNINGYSESDAALNTAVAPAALNGVLRIEINGSSVATRGLLFGPGSDDSSVRGLVINRFGATGIVIQATNITVAGNYIGTDPSGLIDRGNTGAGITNAGLAVDSADAQIGGLNPADRNLISGNTDSAAYPKEGWVIQGNYIGVDATGLGAMGNSTIGASGGLSIDECNNTIVGGSATGATNVISGNLSHGIAPHLTDNLTIQGNYIGVGRDGTTAIANGGGGIVLTESTDAVIGGSAAGEGNIVSNSGGDNIYLGLNDDGVILQGNTIENSTVEGIAISFGTNITIGGMATGESNQVTDSGRDGISINFDASYVTMRGNIVTNSGRTGLNINDANNITIGGTQSGAGNTVSDSIDEGIMLQNGTTAINAQGNLIQSNGAQGIRAQASSDITIGGTQSGAGNTLLNNASQNVLIENSSTDISVQGNSINGSGNTSIDVVNSSDITIGGTQSGAGNTLSNSTGDNIIVDTSSGVEVSGNMLGATSNRGIYVDTSPSTILDGNTIDTAGTTGIQIDASSSTQALNNNVSNGLGDGFTINSSGSSVISGGLIDGNNQNGVEINSSDNVVITDLTISNNAASGIVTSGISGLTIDDSIVTGSGFDGVSLTGNTNPIIRGCTITNNGGSGGILLTNVSGALVGGITSNDRNIVNDNSGQANILVVGFGNVAADNTIQGNYIGVDTQGNVNGSYTQNAGIILSAAVNNSLIGGNQTGSGNRIAGGSGAGVIVAELSITGLGNVTPANNTIIGNSIYDNTAGTTSGFPVPGLGIELATINFDGSFTPQSLTNGGANVPQDPADTDLGPNNYMNFPVLTKVDQNNNKLTVNLNLDAADSTLDEQYRVEFFANDTADDTGYGEGQTYLGYANISNGEGQTVNLTLPTGTNLTGKVLSATTTALTSSGTGFGATSELSQTQGITVQISPLNGLLQTTGDVLAQPVTIICVVVLMITARQVYSSHRRVFYRAR